MLEYDFQKPEDWCYGTDFWMLNDELDETEMCRQLQSMHSQGVACVIVRTYLGLKSDYPGKDWMSKMHAAVTQAKKLGMKLVMQAGYMPEAVLGLPEEYSMGNLCCYPQGQGQGEVVYCHNGIDYCVKPTGHVLDMLSPQACQFYVQQSYENFWKDFREEFGKTIVSVWVDEPSFKAASLPFTKELPKAYEALWKEPFAWDKVHLLFTDDDRKEVIASVDDRLNQNTEENADEGELFRLHYWRTVLYLMKQSYFQSVRDWCDANHLMFSGHLMAEDTMEGQISATCFTMPMYRYFDIPGMDYLTAQMDWNYGALRPERPYNDLWTHYGYFNTPLQCSSVAHQTGKKAVLSEMYGVSSENMGFRDQKYMFDRLASFGINHRSVHAIFYSLRGCGKHAYPPHVSDYQPYWPKYRLLTDAIARESSFLRAGKPVKDVLVLHPIETAFSLYHGRNERGVNDNQKLWRYDPEFNQVLRNLANWQINFELGDEDTIAELGEVSSNRFRVGQMAYKLVVIPPVKFLRETTLALLGKFMEQGGTVLVIGQGPKYSDTGRLCKEALEGAVFADSFRKVREFFRTAPLSYRYEPYDAGTSVQIFMQEEGDDLLFFLMNTDCRRSVSGRLILEGDYRCQHFREYDGAIVTYPSVTEEGKTSVEVELPEGGSLLLRLQKAEKEDKKSSCFGEKAPESRVCLPVKSKWKVKREDPNALVLEMFRFAREGGELSTQDYPISAIQDLLRKQKYEGEILLETQFTCAQAFEGLELVVEYPEKQRINLDGREIDSNAVGFYRTFGLEKLFLGQVEAGIHKIRIRRHFQLKKKATTSVTALFENLGGVELEPLILLGDFAVQSAMEPSQNGCIRFNRDFLLTKEAADSVETGGYPFYCGVMAMETQIELPKGVREAIFSLEGLHAAAAEVSVNGMVCGDLCWAPYEVKLTGLHPGRNLLKIRLFGTLRNLLGPWHRPVGEIGAVWPGGYDSPNEPWEGSFSLETGKADPKWYLDRVPDKPGWTESYLCVPWGIVRPVVCWSVTTGEQTKAK